MIRADTSEHLMDIAQILVSQPLPRGRGVAVVSNAFALSRVIEDACTAHGVEVRRREDALDTSGLETDPREIIREALLAACAPPTSTPPSSRCCPRPWPIPTRSPRC
ncbi:hypothetical protein A5N15_06210 [Rothia kristinae]|uniref:Uncharacterized protein n=1 Tax=Rothia kristinae TaxID=37923 RepID=A0A657IUM6_9MICC|nr:hypothetical protein A5N15_06210 [Rothia kristinae]